jgi:hypothetical protein
LNQQLEQLRVRYKHIREPILVALNILLHDQNIALEDAKAQAALHGVKITAASVASAKRLLARMDGAPSTATPTPALAAHAPRRARPARAPQTEVDVEAVVRGMVTRLQGQGNAEAERLRESIRKAIAVLQAAIG